MIREAELNKLKINKGSLEGKRFPIWDAVCSCPGEGNIEPIDPSDYIAPCPVVDECAYEKKGKCKLQISYLRLMLKIAVENLPEKKKEDEYTLQLIGLNLLPLYKQLCVFKITEHSLGLNVMLDDKMHPIFREIRSVLKDIDSVWGGLGINVTMGPGKKLRELPDPMEHGMPGYYEKYVMTKQNTVKEDSSKDTTIKGVRNFNKKKNKKKKVWNDGL